jgi:uncharacterized protein with NRDE domain
MCVIFIAYRSHAKYPLVALANRDEFYDRPTIAAARWDDEPAIFAGRDLVAGGTWLGVADGGRFAAVTNYRDPKGQTGDRSRGNLVSEFLPSHENAPDYIDTVSANADQYSGFNLIVGNFDERENELWYFSNRGGEPQKLRPGLYGLSNHLLNTSWPKVTRGLQAFSELITSEEIDTDVCFDLLSDETIAIDEDLPDTGVGLERERILSPIFVRTPIYGTRSSSVVTLDNELRWEFREKVFV